MCYHQTDHKGWVAPLNCHKTTHLQLYYWRGRGDWEGRETEVAATFIKSHYPCSAQFLSTACPVPTGSWSGFSSLLPIFPQCCTMQVRMHTSNLVVCPASLPSTTLRLLNLVLDNRITQSPRPSPSPKAFQNLLLCEATPVSPTAFAHYGDLEAFQKNWFMEEAQNRHFRGFLKIMIVFISF